MTEIIQIGISSCLLGNHVRWDGGHKLDRFIRDTLGEWVTFVPVCPEVECGLNVPRETLRLVGDRNNPRLVTTRTGIDYTDQMKKWAEKRLKQLEKENLCGFIFKKGSPSSGMSRVKVYKESGKGPPSNDGIGIFAKAFMTHFPRIPVEDEDRLNDIKIRENFIEQIFTLKRWRSLLDAGKTMGALVQFHTTHKMLIFSHSESIYRVMGPLVASGKNRNINELYDEYEILLLKALKLQTTVKKNINVLIHLMGFFKKYLTADEKREMDELINHYRDGYIPLIVPITLINHFVRKYSESYLSGQYYLNPHPIALKLRNHA